MKKSKFRYTIYSRNTIDKINERLNLLGDEKKIDAVFFLNMRLISSVFIFLVVLYIFEIGYLLAPILTVIYYNLMYYLVIDIPIKKRSEKLDIDAISFFEVMTLSLDAGNGLRSSLELSCHSVDNSLSKEFKKALDEVKFGKSLNEALHDLKKKVPSDSVNNIILSITESSNLGSDVTKDIYRGIDYIREREIGLEKARINKIPLKVSVISVIFYIPLIMLLILGPMLISLS